MFFGLDYFWFYCSVFCFSLFRFLFIRSSGFGLPALSQLQSKELIQLFYFHYLNPSTLFIIFLSNLSVFPPPPTPPLAHILSAPLFSLSLVFHYLYLSLSLSFSHTRAPTHTHTQQRT